MSNSLADTDFRFFIATPHLEKTTRLARFRTAADEMTPRVDQKCVRIGRSLSNLDPYWPEIWATTDLGHSKHNWHECAWGTGYLPTENVFSDLSSTKRVAIAVAILQALKFEIYLKIVKNMFTDLSRNVHLDDHVCREKWLHNLI